MINQVNNDAFISFYLSTPYRSSGEKFLHRGLDKSRQRQNLEALGAKTFYSSTAQQNSSTTAGVWLNR